jgi:hypothetical protein
VEVVMSLMDLITVGQQVGCFVVTMSAALGSIALLTEVAVNRMNLVILKQQVRQLLHG